MERLENADDRRGSIVLTGRFLSECAARSDQVAQR